MLAAVTHYVDQVLEKVGKKRFRGRALNVRVANARESSGPRKPYAKPFEKKPYAKKPFEKKPFEKKPYEKPQVVYKGLLEAMAAACQTPQAKAAVGAGCDQFQLFS